MMAGLLRAFVITCGTAAVAVGQVPATAPTAPATQIAPDQSTPKAALKLLARAMEAGDEPTMRAILLTSNASEEKMVAAMVGLARATSHLHDVAIKQYGEEGAKGLTGDVAGELDQSIKQIDAANVRLDGNRAVVSVPGQEAPPLTLIKEDDGTWRVRVADMATQIDARSLDQRLSEIAAQTAVINRVANEVATGEHFTGNDAAQELHQQMMKTAVERVAAERLPPATNRAATKPAATSTKLPAPR